VAKPVKFALAIHGSRGDVEPGAAVALELARRGHDVRMGVAPNLIGLIKSTGLDAVAYGPDSDEFNENEFVQDLWNIRTPARLLSAHRELFAQGWADMGATLKSLADGADLLLTGMIQQGLAANVAEFYDIPVVSLHWMPVRVNGQLLPNFPSHVLRSAISAFWWLHWRATKRAENVQRRELGLPTTTASSTRRIVNGGSLEIQAYDEFFFPGLADEWTKWHGQRPFVGPLTMELPTHADDEVLSWIAGGTPPIYFGFGSTPVQSIADTVAMISAACLQLGERALIYVGGHDPDQIPHHDHVRLVGVLNYATTFPACRAVVHHGGGGTTAAGLRAGMPTLILWTMTDQPVWAAAVKLLGVGHARRLSATTLESLVGDLRIILEPQYACRAREIAARMTKPAESVTIAADLLEKSASTKRFC
jgi:UDP:flavonoid glycosyltransferase YjiC (YdhE family)